MTREIALTKGYVTLLDDQDYERAVAIGKWQSARCSGRIYAIHGGNPRLYLHRLILPGVRIVDHIDGDGLNNQRSNLRAAGPGTNAINSPKPSDNTTGFKGVARHRSLIHPFRAQITVAGQQMALGTFATPIEAAHAYDAAAFTHFGEFAYLNFPKELSQ